MKIVVLKFGGTSVGTTKKIKKVAEIITEYKKKNYKVIVVSSAMSGVTNELIAKSKKLSSNFPSSEYDVLVSSGEQISCSLIAGRLNELGYKSQSWMGWQLPIVTDGDYKSSRIKYIEKKKILKFIKSGGIPVIAGFQGINNNFRITTLGRGGSDASAIMIAKFFKASKCIIYTDVEGVYSTDPNKFKKAKKIKVISYEEMLEMASLGAKVMQPISIQDGTSNFVSQLNFSQGISSGKSVAEFGVNAGTFSISDTATSTSQTFEITSSSAVATTLSASVSTTSATSRRFYTGSSTARSIGRTGSGSRRLTRRGCPKASRPESGRRPTTTVER